MCHCQLSLSSFALTLPTCNRVLLRVSTWYDPQIGKGRRGPETGDFRFGSAFLSRRGVGFVSVWFL